MAVKVTVTRNSAGTPTQQDTHDAGEAFILRDGQLLVLDATHNNAKSVAVYAAGAWASAVITE